MCEHSTKLIISCSDYNEKTKARSSKDGGGLYLYDLQTLEISKKLADHIGRLFSKVTRFLRWSTFREIHVYDKSFNLLGGYLLDAPNYCGLAYNENHGEFIVINSGRDTISIHEGTDFSLKQKNSLFGRRIKWCFERTSLE